MIRYMLASPYRLFLHPRWYDTISAAESNRMSDDLYGDYDFQRPHWLYVEHEGNIILVVDIDGLWQRCMKKRTLSKGRWPIDNYIEAVVHRNVRMRVYQAMKVRTC